MSNSAHKTMQKVVACGMLTALIFASTPIVPTRVLAVDNTLGAAEAKMDELSKRVQETSEAYIKADQAVKDLEQKMSGLEAQIADLEQKIPEQRQRTSEAFRSLYKMQEATPGLLGLILSADDFNDLISMLQYFSSIRNRHLDELNSLANMVSSLEQSKAELNAERAVADQVRAEAKQKLDEAKAAREEVQAAISAELERQAAEAQAALQKAREEAAHNQNFNNSQGHSTPVHVPDKPSPDVIDMTDDRSAFVATWGPRIDAYLSGSPLAGYGKVFAEASWDYNVDPRWSPAISNTESSKGLYCFRPHNAWGWGNVSWPSWEEAIRAHVRGLAAGYGYTITTAAARKYCPPTWESWYASTLAEMQKI